MTKPLEIEVDGDIEKALKLLKRKMVNEGVLRQLKLRRFYEKPSAERRRKKQENERRLLRKKRRMMNLQKKRQRRK